MTSFRKDSLDIDNDKLSPENLNLYTEELISIVNAFSQKNTQVSKANRPTDLSFEIEPVQ